MELNSIDLAQTLSAVESEIKKLNDTMDIAQQEYSDIQKQIIEIEIQKKNVESKKVDISRYIKMQRHNIENAKLKYEGIKRDFYACKREGR